MSISLGDALLRAAATDPERDAVVLPGERWSYGRLADHALGVARSLAALGVAPGDRVAVLMPNSAECLAALFGTALAGATVVPINARFKPPEMRHILADSEAKVVLTSDLMDAHANLSDQLRLANSDIPIVLLGTKTGEGLIGEAEFDALGGEFERPDVGLRDTAMLLYTSGTTAQPRGCRISHDAIVRVWAGVADAMDITARDAVWNPCPMFHIAAIGVSISCVVVGATNVTTRFFAPDESVALLAAERPSVWYPAYDRIMLAVVNHPRFGEVDLSGLKSVLAVGQPDTLRRLQAAVPDAKLVSTFGMTESAGCAVIARVDDPYDVRMETAGAPVEGLQARLADDGEILLRGPLLFDGYHNEPASPFVDGWFHTGDLGANVHGRITFRGRKKELLRVGGENVAPAQIEACLMTHPAVQMAAVIGKPDAKLDEVPYAFVELRGEATEAELIEHCRASLASFKIPRRVRFVEQWPMSATKIQKFKLRERMVDEGATMPGLVDLWAARTPDADAAVFGAGVSTYAQLAESARRSARALHAAGIGFGDRIGVLLLEGSERYLSLVLGAGRLGAIPVPLNVRFKTRELGYVMRHAGLKLLYTDESFEALVQDSDPPPDCTVVIAERDAAFWAAAGDEPDVTVRPEDPGLMLYTSGTTANPKGCVHSHASMVAEGDGFAERCAVTADDRFWTPLPLFHIGGWCSAFTAFARGGAFVHVGLFEPGVAVEQLDSARCTIAFPAFETIWLHVLQHPRFPAADVSALRLVLNVGVPERLRMMQELLPSAPQVSCTGSTEAGGFLCIGKATDSLHSRTHTNGRPLVGMEIRVVDHETGEQTPVGEVGELLFRGVSRFLYYHDDPEATAATIDAEGFFHTGDLVSVEPDGAVGFVGRIKDMLKVGGENVAAAEIESHLIGHPAVLMAQVVGAPDARYAEVPAAFVIVKPGASVSEQELIDHCLGAIATFKVPRYVRFVQEWPMSGTKIQKYKLREAITSELAAAGITEAPRMKAPAR